MFYQCRGLKSVTWPEVFDISSTPWLYSFFEECTSLESIDLSSWDTSELFSTYNMFASCTKLKSITFGENWDVSGVSDFSNMFYGCSALESVDVSDWIISNPVLSMNNVFYNNHKHLLYNMKLFLH